MIQPENCCSCVQPSSFHITKSSPSKSFPEMSEDEPETQIYGIIMMAMTVLGIIVNISSIILLSRRERPSMFHSSLKVQYLKSYKASTRWAQIQTKSAVSYFWRNKLRVNWADWAAMIFFCLVGLTLFFYMNHATSSYRVCAHLP